MRCGSNGLVDQLTSNRNVAVAYRGAENKYSLPWVAELLLRKLVGAGELGWFIKSASLYRADGSCPSARRIDGLSRYQRFDVHVISRSYHPLLLLFIPSSSFILLLSLYRPLKLTLLKPFLSLAPSHPLTPPKLYELLDNKCELFTLVNTSNRVGAKYSGTSMCTK